MIRKQLELKNKYLISTKNTKDILCLNLNNFLSLNLIFLHAP